MAERLRCDVEAGNDARRLGKQHAARVLLITDHPLRRDVAGAQIFGQCLTDDLAIGARVERFERNGLHAEGASANVRLASAISAKLRERMCMAA